MLLLYWNYDSWVRWRTYLFCGLINKHKYIYSQLNLCLYLELKHPLGMTNKENREEISDKNNINLIRNQKKKIITS